MKKNFIQKNYKWCLVITEILVVLICLLSFLRPLQSFVFEGKNLEAKGAVFLDKFSDGMENGWYIDEMMVETDSDLAENYFIRIPFIDADRGSYQVRISYSTGTDTSTYKTVVMSNQYTIKMGRWEVPLRPDKKEVVFTFESGNAIDDYQLIVNYGGDSWLFVNEISVTETNAWKVKQLIYAVLIIVAIDSLIYLYKRKKYLFEKKHLTTAFLLGLIVIFASLPVFTEYLYNGHDLPFHLNRIEGLKNSLMAGQFPVRMHFSSLDGAGYPVSIFYGDILLYIPAVMRMLGWSVQDAYQIFILLINIATCVIMFLTTKGIFKDEKLAILGTFIYMTAPYRLECIYLRAAVGEYTAMCFYPLIVYGLYRIYTDDMERKENRRNYWFLAAGFCGLVNSHIISLFSSFLMAAFFCVLCIKKTFTKKVFLQLSKAALLTVGMCLWFLLPFVDYMSTGIKVKDTFAPGVFKERTVTLNQLFTLFGGGEGKQYPISGELTGGLEMSYAIGGALLAAIILYVICLINFKRKKDRIGNFGHIVFIFSLIALFATTIYFPYDLFECFGEIVLFVMNGIQFPWRFLSIVSVCASFTAVVVVWWIRSEGKQSIYYNIVSTFIVLGLISASFFMTDYTQKGEKIYWRDEQDVDSRMVGSGEYLPKGAPKGYDDNSVLGSQGIKIIESGRDKDVYWVECSNTTGEEGYVDIPVLNYKNYEAEDSTGKEFIIETGEEQRIRVQIPAYYGGKIRVEYKIPWYWRMSEVISALTVVGMIISILREKLSYNIRKKEPEIEK